MQVNLHSNVRQGISTKHATPRFPLTRQENERLLGFPIVRAYGFQEQSGNLVGLDAAATTLQPQGSPLYRRQVMGIQETGGRNPSTSNNGWYRTVDSGSAPGTASFLLMWYGSFDGDGTNPNVAFGFLDVNDGQQYMFINPSDGTELVWQFRLLDDGGNQKSIYSDKTPRDRVARGVGVLYDAADGNLYFCCSGERMKSAAMGTYVGLGASIANLMLTTVWPGVNGADCTSRYGLLAHGASLDGKGPILGAIFRRYGWQ